MCISALQQLSYVWTDKWTPFLSQSNANQFKKKDSKMIGHLSESWSMATNMLLVCMSCNPAHPMTQQHARFKSQEHITILWQYQPLNKIHIGSLIHSCTSIGYSYNALQQNSNCILHIFPLIFICANCIITLFFISHLSITLIMRSKLTIVTHNFLDGC